MHIKSILARHGIPHTIVTDNGPQFDNHKFETFASKYGFDHITSSPGHAQSNGLAESGVRIVKRMLKKCAENNDDPYLALLNYQSSPLECGKSPAELLMGRNLRTRIPKAELLHAACDPSTRTTSNYDKNARPLKQLNQDDTVRIRHGQQWEPIAKVVKESDAPRSYIFQTSSGKTLRRNRKHLLKTGEKFPGVAKDQSPALEPDCRPTQVPCPSPTKQSLTHRDNTRRRQTQNVATSPPIATPTSTPNKQPDTHTHSTHQGT